MAVLYGVGVGPGDPELLTVKAVRLIRESALVFVPVGERGGPSLAAGIAAPYLDPARQTIVELRYPFVRDRARQEAAWAANAATIAERMGAAGQGVFLTEGDPLLYSTFVSTWAALAQHHPQVRVEVVPGVTSVTAAAAVAGTALALGDERLAVVPARPDVPGLVETLRRFDTVVLLKVSAAVEAVLDALEASGRLAEAVWVRRAGQAGQEIERDVRRLRGQRPDYFSLIIVGGHPISPCHERKPVGGAG
jgi:precorrin-2/cobalt-factor-2 C20-methyltransferase